MSLCSSLICKITSSTGLASKTQMISWIQTMDTQICECDETTAHEKVKHETDKLGAEQNEEDENEEIGFSGRLKFLLTQIFIHGVDLIQNDPLVVHVVENGSYA